MNSYNNAVAQEKHRVCQERLHAVKHKLDAVKKRHALRIARISKKQ